MNKRDRNLMNIYRSDKPVNRMTEKEKAEYHQWLIRRGLWNGELVLQNLERLKKN